MMGFMLIPLALLGFYMLWMLLKDRQDHPTRHGICPHCGSRYTQKVRDNVWRCRVAGCGRIFHVEVDDE